MFDNQLRGLDNYIMGVNKYSEDEVLHKCPKCQATKMCSMFFDMGGWFYMDDNDPYCEKCQCEMIIEEAK